MKINKNTCALIFFAVAFSSSIVSMNKEQSCCMLVSAIIPMIVAKPTTPLVEQYTLTNCCIYSSGAFCCCLWMAGACQKHRHKQPKCAVIHGKLSAIKDQKKLHYS